MSQLRLCRDLANLGWNLCRIIFNLQSIADKMSNTPESNGTLSYTKGSSSKEDMSFSPDLGSEISSEKQVQVKKEEDSSDEKDEVDAKSPYEKKSTPAKKEGHRKQINFTPILEIFGDFPSSHKVATYAEDSPDKHKNPNLPDNSKTKKANFSDYSCNGDFEEARIILKKAGMKKSLSKEFSMENYVKRNTKRNKGASVLENRLSEDIRVDELSQKRPKKGR